jgi:prepilin-type N-terminal cleavage/methylation domain-containing protein
MERATTNLDFKRRRRGFTLIEASLATVIVGVGILSMMQLFTACTRQNAAAADMTTAMLLAENIQETMAGLSFSDPAFGRTYFGPEPGQTLPSYDDVDDFDGKTFSPPIDSTRQPITTLSQYSQVISVWPVYPNQLSANSNTTSPDITQTTYTGAARVTVRILHTQHPGDTPNEVYRTSWIRVDQP